MKLTNRIGKQIIFQFVFNILIDWFIHNNAAVSSKETRQNW